MCERKTRKERKQRKDRRKQDIRRGAEEKKCERSVVTWRRKPRTKEKGYRRRRGHQNTQCPTGNRDRGMRTKYK